MSKILQGFICENQLDHLENDQNKYLGNPGRFYSAGWRSKSKEKKLTTGLVLFSLFLLFLFF